MERFNLKQDSLFGCIQFQSKRQPQAPAISAPRRTTTSYHNLLIQITYVISKLADSNVKSGDAVGLVMSGGPDMAVANLSIACFATTAPLNPNYTEAEFVFYLNDLKPKIVLIESGLDSAIELAARKCNIPIATVCVEPEAPAGVFTILLPEKVKSSAHANSSEITTASGGDIALLLHTSGTTSRPKMVPLSHRNIISTAKNMKLALNIDQNDRCLNLMPMFHIGGLVDLLFSPLFSGGCVFCSNGFSAIELQRHLLEFKPTWTQMVPAMIAEVVKHHTDNPTSLKLNELNFVRSVAAPLPAHLQCQFEAKFGVPLIEVYGMTETTTLITSNPLPPGKIKRGSVGISYGTQVKTISDDGLDTPIGEVGEIVVCGDSIMRGYRLSPDIGEICINTSSFISEWFKTGDVGYFDKDGYLFITGRTKEMINRGGEKISPWEIDYALQLHSLVEEAAAFSLSNDLLGEVVGVAVVVVEGETVSVSDLTEHLRQRLSYFKIPQTFMFVDSLPKTATGKIKRSEIEVAARENSDLLLHRKETYSQKVPNVALPQSDINMMEIWSEVLELEVFDPNANFFALQGDSLKAIKLAIKIEELSGTKLLTSAVFKFPTIVEFNAYIELNYPRLFNILEEMEQADVEEFEL